MDCFFCKIAQHDVETNVIFEDESIIAFHDIAPQAPTHILLIPKKHISTLNDADQSDCAMLGQLLYRARILAKNLGHAEDGYRLVMNCNEEGGQSVYHIHLHLLAGRRMSWPPG